MKAWLPAMPLESPLATRCVKVVEASDSVGLGVLVQRFGMPEERCSCGKDVTETQMWYDAFDWGWIWSKEDLCWCWQWR